MALPRFEKYISYFFIEKRLLNAKIWQNPIF
jgi:hypothetical protein